MALICPQCKTKNRSAAKFCIECISTLPTAFASADTPRASAANSLFGFMRRAEQSQDAAAVSAPAVAEAAQTFSKGMWVSIAALSVALTVGAAGWLVAGAGGWYLYTAGKAQVHPVRADPSAQTEERAASPAAAAEAPAMVTEAQAEKPQLAPTKAPDPVRAASEPAAQAKSVRAPRSAAGTVPGQACSGMNFVLAARCMAAQCEKAEFRAHAQCTTVRRQQLLEEQKRNPVAP